MAVTQVRTFEHVDDVTQQEPAASALGAVAIDWVASGPVSAGSPLAADNSPLLDRITYRSALVVVEGGNRIQELEVLFTERVIAPGRTILAGSDRSNSLFVHLEAELPPTSLQLSFTYHPSPAATPAELLPAISLLEALDASRELGLWSRDSERWAAEPVPIGSEPPLLPEGYAMTVAALARVQRLAQHTFPMPQAITPEDAANISRADRLLAGSTITGRWQHASLVIDGAGLAVIQSASQEHGALLEFTSNYDETIADRTVPLGPAEHRFLQVLLADTEPGDSGPDETVAHLVPGRNDHYELRLIGNLQAIALSKERQTRRRLFAAAGLLAEPGAASGPPPDAEEFHLAELEAGKGRPLADFIIESRT